MSKTARTEAEADGVHPAAARPDALLAVNDLKKHFPIRQGILIQRQVGAVRAVDGVSFSVAPGETLGLVGESGCGKSTTARVVSKLLEPTAGSVMFEGQDIARYSRSRMRTLRTDIQMIFQDPYSSLNPRHTIGTIVGAPFRIQKAKTEKGVKAEVQGLMERVGLNPEHYNRYPHEFSGGQRQRIGIARAIALKPKLIVCDEPVSALDVSVQAQVINLLEDLQNDFNLTYIFVAHDLSVVRHISDRVAVMYLGKIMELTDRDVLYSTPMHPYTHALMSAVPVPDPEKESRRERILLVGDLPSPINPPTGCVFHTRCPKYREILSETDKQLCRDVVPLLDLKKEDHFVACHFPQVRADIAAAVDVGVTAKEVAVEQAREAVAAVAAIEEAVAEAAPAPED
ncbi:MAG TPA: dipeptide ABC transporter ATP-binding protein [Trebonia sp.]|nr:dipeptide ABC transporter ATP-binding protein [Trebonia sp.]